MALWDCEECGAYNVEARTCCRICGEFQRESEMRKRKTGRGVSAAAWFYTRGFHAPRTEPDLLAAAKRAAEALRVAIPWAIGVSADDSEVVQELENAIKAADPAE